MSEQMNDKMSAEKFWNAAKGKALPSLLNMAGIVPRTLGHTLGVGIGGFAAGLAVGAGGALLLTPAKGEELRAMVKDYLQAHIDAVRSSGKSSAEASEDEPDSEGNGAKSSRARSKTKAQTAHS